MSSERSRSPLDGLGTIRRGRRREALLVLGLGVLVVVSIALQARWLDRLGDLLRERMQATLESSTLGAVERLELELLRSRMEAEHGSEERRSVDSRLDADLSRGSLWVAAPTSSDEVSEGNLRSAVQETIEASGSALNERFGSSGLDLEASRRHLFPVLEHEIARLAQLDVGIEIAGGDEAARPLYRSEGFAPSGEPDVEVPLFEVSALEPVLLADTVAFVPEAGDAGGADGSWRLRVWLRSGSVDSVIAGLWRRNVGLGALVTLLLAGTGLLWARAAAARERHAHARAAVLAGISHELRTPLTTIRSASENLAAGVVVEPEAVAEYGRLLERESERLVETVESTLRLARELEKPSPTGEAVDFVALAREAVARVASDAGSAERVVVDSTESALGDGDPEALRAAIGNLVRNALAYAPPGTRIEVGVMGEPERVRVVVDDRGPGFSREERRRVLEPFERGSAAAGGRAGVGLGLSLAALVARRHGGDLVVGDRPGGGARVALELPRRRPHGREAVAPS